MKPHRVADVGQRAPGLPEALGQWQGCAPESNWQVLRMSWLTGPIEPRAFAESLTVVAGRVRWSPPRRVLASAPLVQRTPLP